MNHPLLSIITPVYNGENYIEGCIQNVLNQNCPNVEHIIIDGESLDKTIEIIKTYSEKYSHIRWLSKKDKGQSDAMNTGIDSARGKFIGFLNVDDFYEENVLNRVVGILIQSPKNSFVAGNCQFWDENGTKLDYINKPRSIDFYDLTHLKIKHPYNPSAYFYHKSLHKKVGYYDIDHHYLMDLDFILRISLKAKYFYFDEIWGNMRYMPGTKTYNDKESFQKIKNLLAYYWNHTSIYVRIRYKLKRVVAKIRRKLKP